MLPVQDVTLGRVIVSQTLWPTETTGTNKEKNPRQCKGGRRRRNQETKEKSAGTDPTEQGWVSGLLVCLWEPQVHGASGWQSAGREGGSRAAQSHPWDSCGSPVRRDGTRCGTDRWGGSAPETLTSSLGERVGGRPHVLYIRLAGRPSALSNGRGTGLRHSVQRTSNTVPYSKNRENTFFN